MRRFIGRIFVVTKIKDNYKDMKRTKEETKELHIQFHRSLDQLIACYIDETEKTLTDTNLVEFIEWSYKQTLNPSCFKEDEESN